MIRQICDGHHRQRLNNYHDMMTKCMIALAAAFIFALTVGIVTADGLAIPQFGHSTLVLQY